jgi:hypothetical protein
MAAMMTAKAVIGESAPMSVLTREIVRTDGVLRAMKCSRWKIWDLERNDPEFPAARLIAGRKSWFVDELQHYMETRPRRQYADHAV